MVEHSKNIVKPGRQPVRTGVFICHCGSNIAGTLDCEGLTRYAGTLPGVVFTKNNLYTCSDAGIAEIQNAIKEHALTRVVVASCSPRTHMPLFKSACAEAGLNEYLFEMVNIRDQCSWVHMQEKEKALEKAMDLVRMGVAKASHLEPEEDITCSLVHRALVIGGGIAGLSAAEGLADMAAEVVLVEMQPELGGLLNRIHRLAPRGSKAADFRERLIHNVNSKPNVKIYLDSQVVGLSGFVGNYEVSVEDRNRQTAIEKVGVIVVATGAAPLQPQGLMGYNGQTVITQIELEERLQTGSFDSERVVMIQCVGARSPERPYCSRICCLTAVKNALYIKELNPKAQVHILYRDIQMYGSENERLLWESRGRGIRYDVYDVNRPPLVGDGVVEVYQPLVGEIEAIPYDLVVLSTPLVAREQAASLAQLLRVPIDHNHFFMEAHAKLRPLDFATDGIYVCGTARYPATAGEARAQGLGAASRAGIVLSKDQLLSSALVAEVDAESCVGCQGCLEMCPFGAIEYASEQGVCRVNTILCKGCGNCAATCPSQSINLKGFAPKQLLSQIKAIFS
jgi:heterodisulfide reductase subunit A2